LLTYKGNKMIITPLSKFIKYFCALCILSFSTNSFACVDAVVLVHGNTATPASWDNTVNKLLLNGYNDADIFRPDWGSKTCAACNNHNGSEEAPVAAAINAALNHSCTGKIDVIAHSMGATLAAQQINKLAIASSVDTFIGIAGAFRGLLSCGVYPLVIYMWLLRLVCTKPIY